MGPDRETGHDALVDAIYDAALSTETWPAVLTRIADLSGSLGGVMYRIVPQRGEILGRSLGDLDHGASLRYERDHFVNPWSSHMLAQPAGALVRSDEILPLHALKRSAFYVDVLAPQGIGHSCMAALIARPDLTVAFNICRTVGSGPMDDDQRTLLDRLLPHLRRASQLHLRIERFDALREASLATLDLLTTGIVIVDQWGSVLFANRAALRHGRSHGLVLRDRIVSLSGPGAAAHLRQLVQQAVNGGSGGAMALPDPEAVALPLSVLVAPLRGRLRHEVGAGHLGGGSAVLFIRDPNEGLDPDAAVLMELFGLTRAEARVAVVLFRGTDFAVTAKELGITINTVKTHARRVFGKMGVSRHSEFVHQLASRMPSVEPS